MAASAYITLTAKDGVTPTLKKIQGEMEAMARSVRGFGDNIASFATLGFGAGAAMSIYEVGKASVEAQIQLQKLDKAFEAIYGSTSQAQQQLELIRQTSRELGQEFYSAAEGAKVFFASGQGTGIADQLNDIYTGFTKAGAALSLSSDDMKGIFIALGQVLSKGKVQAEELRGQIGERLPGAFQIAAQAMGMSTAELDKFMADGKLLAEDLLPKMAQVLEDRYGAAAESMADTIQGAVNRMSTAWTDFKANLMDSELVVASLNAISDALEGINTALNADKAGDALTKRMLADEGYRVNRSWQERQGTFMGFLPQRETYYDFTDQQKEAYSAYEGMQAAVDEYIRLLEAREEEILGSFREAQKGLAKKTYEGQAKALKELRDERIKAAKDAAAILSDPSEADKLIADANAQYERDMAKLDKQFSGKASSSARKAAVSQADYNGELERTRQTIESLQQQLGLDKTEDLARAKIRIEQQYQATLSKTNEELTKQVAQGKLTQGQADTLQAEKAKAAELQKQVALRDAEQKAQERQYKDLQTAADFYKELGDLSGEYGESLEYQNRLIEQQAQLYRTSGIPEALVQQWEALKKLESARDPWSGFTRTTNKYFADATNWAQQLGTIWGNTMDGMTDALTEFCMTSKLDFNDLANSFIQQVFRMQMQAAASGLFKGIGSLVMGGLGDMFTTTTSSVTSEGVSYENTRPGGWHRGGLVGVDSPTFTRSVPLMAFEGAPRLHSGGGWFRSDEYPAILQRGERVLNRDETRAYHAGMRAGGYAGAVSVPVNVIIKNESGEALGVEKTGQRRNAQGGLDVDVLVKRVVVNDIAQGNGGSIAKAMQSIYGLKRQARGR